MEIDKIIEQLNKTSCDCYCVHGEDIRTVECTKDCEYCEAVREAVKLLKKIKTDPKIKLLSNVEAAQKIACTTPYETYVWLDDMEYIERAGLRICEVEDDKRLIRSRTNEIR